MKRILLVCTGNTCRSPMAEALAGPLLEQLGLRHYRVTSAGIAAFSGDPASSGAVEAMREEGIDLSAHRARGLAPGVVAEADLILTMTRQQREMVLLAFPDAKDRVFVLKEVAERGLSASKLEGKWDIPDPLGKPLVVYRQVAVEIKQGLHKVFKLIQNESGGRS